ncbi:MAG: FG-GAP repeat domain-containing protein, partial [Phycisphaerae bacterium]
MAVLCVVVTVYGCRERVASSEAAPPGDGNDVEASDAVRAEGVRRGGAAARDTAGASPPFFTDIAQAARLVFAHDAGVDGTYYLPEHLASGAALLDYDGDGDLDIYVINGADHAHRSDTPPVNRLFRREPDGTYLDRTAESGLGDPGYGMGVAVGDYDNDGFVDVYITNYGPDKLYRNSGDGTFTDVTAQAGIANARWSCSASFVDYDLDGFLDIYVGNYLYYPKPKPCTDGAGRPEYCGPQTCPPEPDVLFHNNGDGTFHDVSEPSGIASVRDRALGVVCDDFNGDDWPDIFVANDGGPNFLWINNRDGTFVQSSLLAGVAVNRFGAAEASMGVTVGDVDGDGDLDLFMTHLVHETNTLYRNVGAAGFQDVSAACGLGVSSLKYTGFGTAFFDFDHDGLLDLAVVNGRVRRGPI